MESQKLCFAICDDDSEIVRENITALKKAFTTAFVEPISCLFEGFPDGTDALDWFTEMGRCANIILITDGYMTSMHGFDLLKNLKQQELLATRPILYSSVTDEQLPDILKRRHLSLSDIDFVKKPVSGTDKLVATVLDRVGAAALAAGIALPARKPAFVPPPQAPDATPG